MRKGYVGMVAGIGMLAVAVLFLSGIAQGQRHQPQKPGVPIGASRIDVDFNQLDEGHDAIRAFVAQANDSVTAGSGALKGFIVNKTDGAPVTDFEVVAVKVEKQNGTSEVKLNYFIIDGKFPKAKTNQKGEFIISRLPKGMYSIAGGGGLSGPSGLILDNDGNPRAFEIKNENQTVDIGKVILDK